MLVSKDPIRHDVPHEEGEWFEFVKLSWKKLKKARKKTEEENREIAKSFGPVFLKALRDDDTEEKARRLIRRQQYDETNFDTEILLFDGVVAWSYEGPVDQESIEQLDERTVVWAKQVIIDITRPPDEEEVKNS